jgi:hypothetical protein
MTSAEAESQMANLFQSPLSLVIKPKSDPVAFETPVQRQSTKMISSFSVDDDISTAEPSLWAGSLDSPWCSATFAPGPKQRGSFHLPKGVLGFDGGNTNAFLNFKLAKFDVAHSSVPVTAAADQWQFVPDRTLPDTAMGSKATLPPIISHTGSVSDEIIDPLYFETPPCTPRQDIHRPSTPPPAPKSMLPLPPLLKALNMNSVEHVREALLDEPDAARFPFWDHQMEPPLCFALKHNCTAKIMRWLLQHGADKETKDLKGMSPADILRSMRTSKKNSVNYPDIDVVEQMFGGASQPFMTQTFPPKDGVQDVLSWMLFSDAGRFDFKHHLPPWATEGRLGHQYTEVWKLQAAL